MLIQGLWSLPHPWVNSADTAGIMDIRRLDSARQQQALQHFAEVLQARICASLEEEKIAHTPRNCRDANCRRVSVGAASEP